MTAYRNFWKLRENVPDLSHSRWLIRNIRGPLARQHYGIGEYPDARSLTTPGNSVCTGRPLLCGIYLIIAEERTFLLNESRRRK